MDIKPWGLFYTMGIILFYAEGLIMSFSRAGVVPSSACSSAGSCRVANYFIEYIYMYMFRAVRISSPVSQFCQ